MKAIMGSTNETKPRHRRLIVACKVLTGMLVFVVCIYATVLYTFARTVPQLHQKYVTTFDGLTSGSNIGNSNYAYWGCHNESKFAIHLVCDRSYSHEYEPLGKQAEDEQRIRNIYDRLVSDGWTGGSKPNLYDVVPATKGSELQPDDNGTLYVSAWKSIGLGVACDINISYTPVLPHIRDDNGSYDYNLYCRRSMFP